MKKSFVWLIVFVVSFGVSVQLTEAGFFKNLFKFKKEKKSPEVEITTQEGEKPVLDKAARRNIVKKSRLIPTKKKVSERKRISKLNTFGKKHMKALKKEYKKNAKKQQSYTEKLIGNAEKCVDVEKGSLTLSISPKKTTSSARKSITYQKKYRKLKRRGTLKKAIKRESIIPETPTEKVEDVHQDEVEAPEETVPVEAETEAPAEEVETEAPAETEKP